MSSRLLDLDLFDASLFGDIGFDDDSPFNTLSPGRIRIPWFHLIASPRQTGRTTAFTGTLASWARSHPSHAGSSAFVSKS
jgi:hypothetical protein